MPYIAENTVEHIKERLNIVDVVRDYVKLSKKGRNWIGVCPFHMEKTPSFFVNEEKNIYHCFGCGAGGNMFNFIMNIENISFPESINILAKKAGITIEYKSGHNNEVNKEKDLIYQVNERAVFIFQYYLKNRPEAEKARNYLFSRKINQEMIDIFKLGYAPDSHNKVYQELLNENYNTQSIIKAGLANPAMNNKGYYDKFRDRVMFPIINVLDRVIGFGGRVLTDNPNLAKYMNTAETEVFLKRKNLYAINLTRNFIREKHQAIIVEGYFDVIALFQNGIKNVVAPLGTALTEDQVLLLKRYADEIILLFDSDKAGNAATIKGIALLLNTNLKIKIVELPSGYDPADYVTNFKPENLLQLISKAPSFLKFIVKDTFKKYNSKNAEGKNKIISSIFPVIQQINDEITKAEVFRYLANKLKVEESLLKSEFLKFTKTGKMTPLKMNQKKTAINAQAQAERFIVMSMLEASVLIPQILTQLNADYFSDPVALSIFKIVQDFHQKHQQVLIEQIIELIPETEIRQFIITESISEKYSHDIVKQLNDCIFKIKQNRLKELITHYNEKLKQTKNFNEITAIEKKIQEIIQKKSELSLNKNKIIIALNEIIK